MLFPGIYQHACQLTVSRNQQGMSSWHGRFPRGPIRCWSFLTNSHGGVLDLKNSSLLSWKSAASMTG